MDTYFAPSRRTATETLQEQIKLVYDSPLVNTLLSSLAGVLVILNEDRQIVGLNHAFLDALHIANPEKALGLRLGESLGCVNAGIMAGGCGTSQPCASCGAVIAIMAVLNGNENEEKVCALSAETDGVKRSMALLVRVTPLELLGHRLLVVTVKDISKEQMRANLERVFYHDLNNMLTGLLAPSEMLLREQPENWKVSRIYDTAKRLRQEIALQRELSRTGGHQFVPEKTKVLLSEISSDIELLIRDQPLVRGRTIETVKQYEDCRLLTDKLLVSRVLANMLINALEATKSGGVVRFVTRRSEDRVVWQVWNEGYIPPSIQKRIFQRYFSSKPEAGRGLGTFSMKLFGETFLKGEVGFTTTKADGTNFHFSLPVLMES